MVLTDEFIQSMRDYDPALSAIYDARQDAIIIFSTRQGRKTLELSIKREYGELYGDMRSRTLRKLKTCDAWKIHGSGKAYDDYLYNEEMKLREQKKKEIKTERLARMKDERLLWKAALWNAQHGRMTAGEAEPFEIASERGVDIQDGKLIRQGKTTEEKT